MVSFGSESMNVFSYCSRLIVDSFNNVRTKIHQLKEPITAFIFTVAPAFSVEILNNTLLACVDVLFTSSGMSFPTRT